MLQSVVTLTQEPGLALLLLSGVCMHTCEGKGGGLTPLLREGFWRLQLVISVGPRLPPPALPVPAGGPLLRWDLSEPSQQVRLQVHSSSSESSGVTWGPSAISFYTNWLIFQRMPFCKKANI